MVTTRSGSVAEGRLQTQPNVGPDIQAFLQAMEQLRQDNVEMQRQMEEMQKNRSKDEMYTAHTNTSYVHTGATHDDPPTVDLDGHLFTVVVMIAPFPESFKMPKMKKYDGTSDPDVHLMLFNAQMLTIKASDRIKCRAFPTTLEGSVLVWYSRLPPLSIHNFDELKPKFNAYFAMSRPHQNSSASLVNFCQGPTDSLRDLMNRFT